MMGTAKHYISDIQKRMFFLAFLTAFFSVFVQTLAVLADYFIICAFFNETEIAASSLASPFFYLLEVPAAGLAAGIQTVFAKDLGAGEVNKVNRQFSQIFFLMAAVLTVFTILSFLFVPQLAVLFGARGATAALQPYAAQYLYGLSFEIIPYVLFCIMVPAVILDNGSKLVSIASFLGCAADIILDLCSVHFGWGLFGIGIASSVSAFIYFFVTLLHFAKPGRLIRLHFIRPEKEELKEIFTCARPAALQSISETCRSTLFIYLASITGGMAGTFVLSVHAMLAYAIAVIANGIAGAAAIMAGINSGEKNGEDMEGSVILANRYISILSLIVIAVLVISAHPLAAAMASEPEAAELLVFAVYCLCASIPFSWIIQTRISYLQAIGHIEESERTGIMFRFLSQAVTAGILVFPFGIKGVFLSFPVSAVLTLCVILFNQQRRTKKKIPSFSDYLELDDSFYPSAGDVISYPLKTLEDCAIAAEQVTLFCRGHKIDERKCRLAGLCVEELSTNVMEHGRKTNTGTGSADIRIVIDGEDVIIRLRDDRRAFNPNAYEPDLAEMNRSGKGAGIRILQRSAKSISYYRTYGMNTVIVTV